MGVADPGAQVGPGRHRDLAGSPPRVLDVPTAGHIGAADGGEDAPHLGARGPGVVGLDEQIHRREAPGPAGQLHRSFRHTTRRLRPVRFSGALAQTAETAAEDPDLAAAQRHANLGSAIQLVGEDGHLGRPALHECNP